MCVFNIPASRNFCGFLGHHAKMACNKCYKEFNDKKDYSGYDVSGWKLRTNCNHRMCIAPYYKLETQNKRKELENKYGIRSSVLSNAQPFPGNIKAYYAFVVEQQNVIYQRFDYNPRQS